MNTMIASRRYNSSTRSIAHGVKNGDIIAMKKAAADMAALIPDNAVLVPMPSHLGYATAMVFLCQELSGLTGASVCDALIGCQRKTHYSVKKAGGHLSWSDMKMRLNHELPSGKNVIIVDNVIDTGATALAAMLAVGNCSVVAYAMTQRVLKRYASLCAYPTL